eukprot:SAG31_NODE_708_length_12684_cov_8.500199_3_plen_91_part_00
MQAALCKAGRALEQVVIGTKIGDVFNKPVGTIGEVTAASNDIATHSSGAADITDARTPKAVHGGVDVGMLSEILSILMPKSSSGADDANV